MAAKTYPALFDSWRARVQDVSEDALGEVAERIPPDWMSDAAREFAIALMRFNLSQLREILR